MVDNDLNWSNADDIIMGWYNTRYNIQFYGLIIRYAGMV